MTALRTPRILVREVRASLVVALVIAPVAREYGLEYVTATVTLGRIFQLIFVGVGVGVAKLMRGIPRSVMLGFVNALAILIFMVQLPHPSSRWSC